MVKAFSVIDKTVFVLSVVSAILTLVSGFVLIFAPEFSVHIIKGVTASTRDTGIELLAESAVLACEAVVAFFLCRYFEHELHDGTPFTHRGARELFRVGVINLSVPIVGLVIAKTILTVFKVEHTFHYEFDLIAGLVMMLLSFVFHYGADLEEIYENQVQKEESKTK